jgi:hypothetical protein
VLHEGPRIKNELADFLHQAQAGHWQGDLNAAIPHLLRAAPFLGPATEQVAVEIAKKQFPEAAGHFLSLGEAELIPKLAGGATTAAANIRDLPAMARGAAEGGAAAITKPTTITLKYGGVPLEIPIPAWAKIAKSALGGGGGYFAGGPLGATIGAVGGIALPFLRGASKGALTALDEAQLARINRAAAQTAAREAMFRAAARGYTGPLPPERQITAGTIIEPPADTSFVRSVPGEYAQREPLPPSRQLPPGRQIYQMPAAADTSYVRGVPAEYATAEQPPTAAAPPPPGEVPAATAAFERAPLVNEPPEPAPAATAEIGATAEEVQNPAAALREAMGLKPGEMEAPAPAAEDTAAAAIERQKAANKLINAISPKGVEGVSSDLASSIPADTWNQIAELAKLPAPDPETIQTVIKTLAAKEGRPAAESAARGPAEAPPAEAEAPPANAAEELARMMPGYKPPAPAEGPRPATAAENRIEAIAKSVAADQRASMQMIEDPEVYPSFFEDVARKLKLNRPAPGEPELILNRIRELRGGGEEPPAAAEAAPRFEREKIAAEVEHAASLEDRFRSIVADLRATAGDKAEQIIREQLPSRYPGWVGLIPTEELHADPVRFQYKMDVGQGGAGAKLKKVQTWNPDLAGTIQVWKDPANGKTYVINGHHRLELAQRLGVKEVKVDYLHAADATEARIKGALTNIAEGNGSVMDAAKLLRDTGMTPDQVRAAGVELGGRIAKPGIAIAKLHPTLFQAVLSGDMAESRGAILGDLPQQDQLGMYKLIEQAERRSGAMKDSDVAEMVRLGETAPKITEQRPAGDQPGMFDDDAAPVERSLAPEKAQASSYIREQLRHEKRLFGTVSSQAAAERLGAAGNVIETAKNQEVTQRAAQVQDLYDRLSKSAGPVDQALNQAARAIAEGENARSVYERTYRSIRDELEQQIRKYSGEKPGSSAGTPLFDGEGPDKTGSGQ